MSFPAGVTNWESGSESANKAGEVERNRWSNLIWKPFSFLSSHTFRKATLRVRKEFYIFIYLYICIYRTHERINKPALQLCSFLRNELKYKQYLHLNILNRTKVCTPSLFYRLYAKTIQHINNWNACKSRNSITFQNTSRGIIYLFIYLSLTRAYRHDLKRSVCDIFRKLSSGSHFIYYFVFIVDIVISLTADDDGTSVQPDTLRVFFLLHFFLFPLKHSHSSLQSVSALRDSILWVREIRAAQRKWPDTNGFLFHTNSSHFFFSSPRHVLPFLFF